MSPTEVFHALAHASLLLGLLPVLAFAKSPPGTLPFRILLVYLYTSLLSDIGSYYLLFVFGTQNNLNIHHAFQVVELILLLFLYMVVLKWPIAPILISAIVIVFWLLLYYFLPGVHAGLFRFLAKGTLVVLAICYYSQLFATQEVPNIFRDPFAWINTAILFYFGVTLLLGLFQEFMGELPLTLRYFLWSINLLSNVIYNFLLATGVWMNKRNSSYT